MHFSMMLSVSYIVVEKVEIWALAYSQLVKSLMVYFLYFSEQYSLTLRLRRWDVHSWECWQLLSVLFKPYYCIVH